MYKSFRFSYSVSTKLKESVTGTAKAVAQDAKRATAAASQALQDDFQAVASAVASSSDKLDEKVRDIGNERFHAAEEAAANAEKEDRKFVMSEDSENPINKAAKMAHDAKDSVKETLDSAAQKAANSAKRAANAANLSYSEPTESMTQKVEKMAETVVGKVKETVNTVKDTLTGASKPTESTESNINPAASINTIGREPDREPLKTPSQEGQSDMNKETKELQKKGADRKSEEDSFNLM